MGNKKIFLHIGMPKSASTTIQLGLALNKEQLQQQGFLYPSSGFTYYGQHNIVWELLDDHRFLRDRGNLQDLKTEFSRSKFTKMIVSSEDLVRLNQEQIKQLLGAFGDKVDTVAIIYIRRQDQWLQSRWSQFAKAGLVDNDFNSWLNLQFIREENKPFLWQSGDYYPILYNWFQVIGKENVIVRVLEKPQISTPILYDFLELSGIEDVSKFKVSENTNVSPSIKTLEIIRFFTKCLLKYSVDEKLQRRFAQIILAYSRRNKWNKERLNLIDKELYLQIQVRFMKSNQAIAELFLNRNKLFLEEFVEKPITEFNISSMDPKEVFDLFSYFAFQIGAVPGIEEWKAGLINEVSGNMAKKLSS